MAELCEASVRFEQIIDAMEVLLDRKTMRRIRLGKNQYHKKACVLARDAGEILKVLSSSFGSLGIFIQGQGCKKAMGFPCDPSIIRAFTYNREEMSRIEMLQCVYA